MHAQTHEGEPEAPPEKPTLFERFTRSVLRTLSRMDRRCRHVEQAKAIAERENTRKHGKDWVNRCCG